VIFQEDGAKAMKKFLRAAVVSMFGFGAVSQAVAAVANVDVSGSTVTAKVQAAGGVSADLTLRFESAGNLSVQNLGMTADAVDPLNPALLARLPASLVAAPPGFAVLLQIAPSGGFYFNGMYEIELYTKDLHYVAGSPLRLYSAHNGGAFKDITTMIAGGSYRTRGGGGNFSDFLIVADARPLQTTTGGKYDAVSTLLSTHAAALGFALNADLTNRLATSRNAWIVGDYTAALTALEGFRDAVVAAATAGSIPNRWTAGNSAANVGGEIRAAAETLRFSLTLGANGL
jgi:hypothetical protein